MSRKSISSLLAVMSLVACGSVTTQQPVADVQKTARSGFLTDPSLLQPGKEGEAALRYIRPNVDWNSYTGIFLEPVVFISDPSSKIDATEQQVLTSYYYNVLKTHLATVLPIVDHQGPHVLVVRAALTDVKGDTPGLRTISVVVPQARLLNSAQSLATDTYAFVGSAKSEGEITDGGTGQILAEGVDGRSGGMSMQNAGEGKWGDAEHAMDYWAELTANRLRQVKSGGPAS
ncbi:DUF3313 domain-containing protein [Paraburkholderia sp. JHI2823]|uniref:DUF3313 domain-containing protein n=1 Tax=Paraburkholderia sp. JHI2823 TaxID=3112960 RepID=UPI00317239CD